MEAKGPIGVFDSGYGGLTILKDLRRLLPQYDYLYLGDNARAPYGTRSFEVVYQFTLQAVRYLFDAGCHLVILACNTASAKALRSIQQNDLPSIDSNRRVLGVIRPTVEILPSVSKTNHIGVFATPGTIASHSYSLEISKIAPHMHVTEVACPMWVSLVENREAEDPGADYFVNKYISIMLASDPLIDTVVLGCTHYPLLFDKIKKSLPPHIKIISQGDIVAESLSDYLARHPEMDSRCTQNSQCTFLTTEQPEKFNALASIFLNDNVKATKVEL